MNNNEKPHKSPFECMNGFEQDEVVKQALGELLGKLGEVLDNYAKYEAWCEAHGRAA